MIIARGPLRITLGGGGTDLPSYYEQHGGFVLAAAIDKYVYITIHDNFADDLIVKYSKLERVRTAAEIEHPIFREALRLLNMDGKALEITSMADIPAGTGLGSSGSFTTALLRALHSHRKDIVHPRELAEEACHIEIGILHEETGKQDQYVAAFGGITRFIFQPDGSVDAAPVAMTSESQYNLEDNLLLFFTGYSRNASQVLHDQNRRTLDGDLEVERNLTELKALAQETFRALEAGDLTRFACFLNEQWEHKKRRGQSTTNADIDRWYQLGMANGALGGKLVGAGGGGFLMFYAEDKTRLRRAMMAAGLRELRFRFDFAGTAIVIHS